MTGAFICPFIFKLWNTTRRILFAFVREQWLHQQYAELNARIRKRVFILTFYLIV